MHPSPSTLSPADIERHDSAVESSEAQKRMSVLADGVQKTLDRCAALFFFDPPQDVESNDRKTKIITEPMAGNPSPYDVVDSLLLSADQNLEEIGYSTDAQIAKRLTDLRQRLSDLQDQLQTAVKTDWWDRANTAFSHGGVYHPELDALKYPPAPGNEENKQE